MIEIRRFFDTDNINDVSRVFALSWKTAYRGIVPQDYLDAIPENRWSPYLAEERPNIWLVSADGQIAVVSSYVAAQNGWGKIKAIYLLPVLQRKGIGSKLLHQSMYSLFVSGCHNIYLWVLEENTSARKFYEKNGFLWNGDRMLHLIGGKPCQAVRYIYCKCEPFFHLP